MTTNRTVRMVWVLFAFAFAGMTAFGNNWYVSKQGSDSNTGNSWAAAKKTIQAAIDAAGEYDTITVGAGVYSAHTETGGVVSVSTKDKDNKTKITAKCPCVVLINKSLITLTSTNREATVIEGLWDTSANPGVEGGTKFEGVGPAAVRGIHITGNNIKIIGFTIRNCATVSAYSGGAFQDSSLRGAGITFGNSSIFVYDCDFQNCRAGEGPAAGGSAVGQGRFYSCRFSGNKANGGQQVLYRTYYHRNCLFLNNGRGSGQVVSNVQGGIFVNCTFVNNNVTRITYPNAGGTIMQYFHNCAFLTKQLCESETHKHVYACNSAQVPVTGRLASTADGNITNCTVGISKYVYYSPDTNDWSPMVGSELIDAGVDFPEPYAEDIPERWYTTDLLGNQRTFKTVDIGCIEAQDLGTKSGVAIEVKEQPVKINGTTYQPTTMWTAMTTDGMQVRVTPGWTTGEELFCMYLWDSSGVANATGDPASFVRWPDLRGDNGFWLTLPKAGHADGVSIQPYKSTGTLYADANYKGAVQDGTEAHPFVNINSAISNALSYSVIKVKPGVYNKGTTTGKIARDNPEGGADDVVCRVSIAKDVALRSTAGAEKTIITGGDEICAVRMSNYEFLGQLQGFTLTGANCPKTRGSAFNVNCKAAFDYEYGRRSRVSDCIISNNFSYSAINGGWAERCRFEDNRIDDTTISGWNIRGTTGYGTICSACIVGKGNRQCLTALASCTVLNCTFAVPYYDCLGVKDLRPVDQYSRGFNCAMFDGYVDVAANSTFGGFVRTYEHTQYLNRYYITEYPHSYDYFVNAEEGDYRPMRTADGLSRGVWSGEYHIFDVGDINGEKLAYDVGRDSPYPGAYQTSVRCATITCDYVRGSVTPSNNVELVGTGTLVVKANGDGHHKLLGFVVNGKTNFTDNATCSCAYNTSTQHITIEALVSNGLYVNPNMSDSNNGMTPATAKRTLKAIMGIAIDGDIVYAAEGTYKEGEMTNYANQVIGERVAIPAGVSLVATGSRDKTIIYGRWHDEATKNRYYQNAAGCKALRCVQMNERSYLEGFTVKHGSGTAWASAPNVVDNQSYPSTSGGCVCGPIPMALSNKKVARVRNCVLVEGGGRWGGAAYGCVLENCYIYDHATSSVGSMTYGSRHINCVAKNPYDDGQHSLYNHYGVYNSTIYSAGCNQNNEDMKGSGSKNNQYPVVNSIVYIKVPPTNPYNGTKFSTTTYYNWKNCIFKTINNPNWESRNFDSASCSNIITLEFDACKLDANNYYAPKEGSPVIDAGDKTLVKDIETLMECDFFGNPRVMNGQIDLGASEYDWREDYFESLDYLRLKITEVSEDVTSVDGQMKLVEGANFTVDFDNLAGIECLASFTITGTGKLKMVDALGIVIGEVGAGTTSFDISGHDKVTFEFEGEGNAVIGKFRSNSGTLMIFR